MATIDYLQYFPQSVLNREATSNLGKLWTMFSEQLDEIEAQLTLMYLRLNIATQTGLVLDQIGKLLNEPRNSGATDAEYRIELYIAIKSKTSGGSISEILEITEMIRDGDATKYAYLNEYYPANIQVATNISELIESDLRILKAIKAAGIGLQVNYFTGSTPFVFYGDSDGLGFDEIASEAFELTTGDGLELTTGDILYVTNNEDIEGVGGNFTEVYT